MNDEDFIAAMLLMGYDPPMYGYLFPATHRFPCRIHMRTEPPLIRIHKADSGVLRVHTLEYDSYEEALAYIARETHG